jgi:predicted methyltransferase
MGGQEESRRASKSDGVEMLGALEADPLADARGRELAVADEVGEVFAEVLEGLAGAAVEQAVRGTMP